MIETERLILRPPEPQDIDWQREWLNTPAVMRHLGGVRDPDDLVRGFAINADAFAAGEPGFFTVVRRSDMRIVGKCGLARLAGGAEPAEMRGGVQIGWTLAEPFWGLGFASEAARAAIGHGFDGLELDTIWSMTSDSNQSSTRMMARLGLTRCPELDFVDPNYPAADNPTTVYRIGRTEWKSTNGLRPEPQRPILP